jgi:hypothetical protein
VKPDFYLFTREIMKGICAIGLIEKKTKTCSLISFDYSTQISFKKRKRKKTGVPRRQHKKLENLWILRSGNR